MCATGDSNCGLGATTLWRSRIERANFKIKTEWLRYHIRGTPIAKAFYLFGRAQEMGGTF
jgi:hypothetical protein